MGILAGKSVLVTGGGGGIGRATCQVLADAGARLVVSDVSAATGEETAQIVRDGGGEAIFVAADLASEAEIEALIAAAVETYGKIDGAFNNAGVEQRNKPLADLSLAEWERAIVIDLTAVFLCMKYQIKAMLQSGGGSIVNTASSLGQVGLAGASEYCAAKHGVLGVTRASSAEYGPLGIRINAVMPGITMTPLIARLCEDEQLAAHFQLLRKRHAIGRFAEPDEIGQSVKWLLSDDASFVNGSALQVDGGFLSI